MGEDAKRTFKLYALPLSAENIAAAANERFSRATPTPEPGYVLIFTDGAAPEHAAEITEETAKLLSPADVRWLIDSNAAIVAEEIERRKPEVLKQLSEQIETLETELRRKKDEITSKGE